MTLDYYTAWAFSISLTGLLYYVFLARLFPILRAHRHLQSRWAEYGSGIIEKWEKVTPKVDDKRLKSLQVESKLKSFLSQPIPAFKQIEFLLYRSGFFPNIKVHFACQIFSSFAVSDAIFITYGLPIGRCFLFGISASLFGHFMFLRFKEKTWKKSFVRVFPVALDIITRGLKSGMTLGRGVAMVSEEVEDPVGSEFNYIASQLQIGITPDDALTEAAARIGIEEFRFFSLALIIQREMGGSLADILGKLSEVIRERDRFRKKVWTLSAESRATALIVGSLPIFLAIVVEFITPGYTKFFFTDPKGKIMLWICIGLSVTGALVITRMMRVEE